MACSVHYYIYSGRVLFVEVLNCEQMIFIILIQQYASFIFLFIMAVVKSSIDINDHVEFELAPIGLGTAGLGANTAEIVRSAVLEHGVRLIDTAQAEEWYSEDGVNRGLRAASDGLQIDTPVTIVTKIHPRSFALEKMRERLERSISLLLDPFSRNSTVRTELVVLLHSTRY